MTLSDATASLKSRADSFVASGTGTSYPVPSGVPNSTIQDPVAALAQNPLGSVSSAVGSAVGSIAGVIFSTRLVAVVLGLIAIAGAIYLFKGGDIVEDVKGVAATAAG